MNTTIDLHLHTVYSDGELTDQDIINYAFNASLISVTDHNSVKLYEKLGELPSSKLIVGTELTVEGFPDCLLFFPSLDHHNHELLNEIENQLLRIRQAEELNVRRAYQLLKETETNIPYTDWDSDIALIRSAQSVKLEGRTADLAQIRFLHRTHSLSKIGFFEKEDLTAARIARRNASSGDLSEFGSAGFLKSYGAESVLAHPIRTAYIRAGRTNSTYDKLCLELNSILADFFNNNGQCVEWEYISENDRDRQKLIYDHQTDLRNQILSFIDSKKMYCLWGTDTHKYIPNDAEKWSQQCENELSEYCPPWIKERMLYEN